MTTSGDDARHVPEPSLENLLSEIERRDVVVGVPERRRLMALLRAEPRLSPERFANLVAALVARDLEQREAVAVAVQRWSSRSVDELERLIRIRPESPRPPRPPRPHPQRPRLSPSPEPSREPSPAVPPQPPRNARRFLSACITLCVGLFLLARIPFDSPAEPREPVDPPARKIAANGRGQSLPSFLAHVFAERLTFVVDQVPKPVEPRAKPVDPSAPPVVSLPPLELRPGWPALASGLAALSLFVGLFVLLWTRQVTHRLAPSPIRPGRRYVPWIPGPVPERLLIPSREARQVIWAVEKFEDEERTQRLDVARTVRATARAAGTPVIARERLRDLRAVWIWIDERAEHPTIGGYAEELAELLTRGGLHVRRGAFLGVPHEVTWSTGEKVSTLALEGSKRRSIVLLLTDGKALGMAGAPTREDPKLVRLLAQLGTWPRLAFVEFGRGRSGLEALARRHGIRRVTPEAVPAFLGSTPQQVLPEVGAPEFLEHELRTWSGALALCPYAFDPETAEALRLRLGLSSLSARDFERAIVGARADGAGWSFAGPTRARLVNDLVAVEEVWQGKALREASWLAGALRFWQERLEEQKSVQRLRAEEPGWEDTPAGRRLALRSACLMLWFDPRAACESLEVLAGNELAAERSAALAHYETEDAPPELDRMRLPWRLSDQPLDVQWKLSEMGISGVNVITRQALSRAGLFGAICCFVLAVYFLAPPPGEDVPPERVCLGARLMLVPRGGFWMGSPGDEEGRPESQGDDEALHQVRIMESFWMWGTELTQGQWWEVMRTAPWKEMPVVDGARYPAVGVSWEDAVEFCRKLTERERSVGRLPRGMVYRLPTEAEWEYACRAGVREPFSFGHRVDAELVNCNYGWPRPPESGAVPAGSLRPNEWGLYEMHGNVKELCFDRAGWFGGRSGAPYTDVYPSYPEFVAIWEDPIGQTGEFRIQRGGSWKTSVNQCRSAARGVVNSGDAGDDLGFRPVLARVP